VQLGRVVGAAWQFKPVYPSLQSQTLLGRKPPVQAASTALFVRFVPCNPQEFGPKSGQS